MGAQPSSSIQQSGMHTSSHTTGWGLGSLVKRHPGQNSLKRTYALALSDSRQNQAPSLRIPA
jgi:hypothetical protein